MFLRGVSDSIRLLEVVLLRAVADYVGRFRCSRDLSVCLRPLACCDGGFESCRRHECLSLVNVVSCRMEVSA
jgi:hypothetical protein